MAGQHCCPRYRRHAAPIASSRTPRRTQLAGRHQEGRREPDSFPEGRSTFRTYRTTTAVSISYVYSACAYGSDPCDISAHVGRKNVPRLLASCVCVVACARGYTDTGKEEMDLDPKVHRSVIQRADTGKATGNCLDSCCKMVV